MERTTGNANITLCTTVLWCFKGIALKSIQVLEDSAALVRRHRGTNTKAVDGLSALQFHEQRVKGQPSLKRSLGPMLGTKAAPTYAEHARQHQPGQAWLVP